MCQNRSVVVQTEFSSVEFRPAQFVDTFVHKRANPARHQAPLCIDDLDRYRLGLEFLKHVLEASALAVGRDHVGQKHSKTESVDARINGTVDIVFPSHAHGRSHEHQEHPRDELREMAWLASRIAGGLSRLGVGWPSRWPLRLMVVGRHGFPAAPGTCELGTIGVRWVLGDGIPARAAPMSGRDVEQRCKNAVENHRCNSTHNCLGFDGHHCIRLRDTVVSARSA